MSATQANRERPILFSGPMVRAILAGRKTQTRRIVKPQPPAYYSDLRGPERYLPTVISRDGEERPGNPAFGIYSDDGEWGCKCPYESWMKLWVRETWAEVDDEWGCPIVAWRAGGARVIGADGEHNAGTWRQYIIDDSIPGNYEVYSWKPSIFMPRYYSRITLEITQVRVQRLQEISAADILAEGAVEREHYVEGLGKCPVSAFDGCCYPDLKSLWASGWDSLNGKKHPWSSNPWVWAISFRRLGNER